MQKIIKPENRNCFKCHYHSVTDLVRCPRCRAPLQTARKTRTLGALGVLCGGFISIFTGGVAVFIGLMIAHPEKWGVHLTADDDQSFFVIFGVLGLIFALGLTFVLAGFWQIVFARQNKYLIRTALVLILVVFGGSEIFVALLGNN